VFIDARSVAPGAKIAADLCIVGAGAAGITFAQRLADSGIDICLLESGDLDFNWQTQALYEGRNVGLPYYALGFCQIRYFGGNTNGWGGWCRPFDPIDFRERSWVEHSGWPWGPETLAPYYPEAHRLCQIPSDDYDPERVVAALEARRGCVLPLDPEKLETTIYRFSAPTRFGQVYREAVRQAGSVRCYLNANVLAIRATSDATAVKHLEVGCLSGTRFTVTAKHFVLAAGGIENTRLLLLSNDVAPRGLGNDHDIVGRYFMEHPHTKRVLLASPPALSSALYGLAFHGRGVSARISLPEAVQEREELLNYSANIHAVYPGQEDDGWAAFRKLVLSLSQSRHTDPFIRFPPYGRKGLTLAQVSSILRRLDRVTVAAFLQLFEPAHWISGFLLESKCEQAPNPESRVTLDHPRDAFGLNRVKLDWRTLPIDRRSVIRGEEIVEGELRRLGIGQLAPLAPEENEAWPSNLEGGWHQIGTTRMHVDPRQGVVDADGRVHGLSNLYIASGSVFPTGSAAPPTLTVVALALRLADHLRQVVTHRERAIVQPARRSTLAAAAARLLTPPLSSRPST